MNPIKSDHVAIRIKPELKEKLIKIAELEPRSQSQQIEYWIDNYKLKEEKANDR